ncbi:alpha/beta-hydrolase [Auricularia subglabra TFB-10046 SS5]|nr:alpha/beta-hydrolase [Auricularia subglabra TFB-10046 SS5]
MRTLTISPLAVFPLACAASLVLPSVWTASHGLGTRLAENPTANSLNITKRDFLVDESKTPLLQETVQDSYAGLLPLTNDADEKQSMFFWYWPSSAKEGSQSLAIWLNGGPGCSSLIGFLNENGAFTVSPTKGVLKVSPNKFSWSTVSDILYIHEQQHAPDPNSYSDVNPSMHKPRAYRK